MAVREENPMQSPNARKPTGPSYDTDEQAKAKRKANAYRAKYRKSFAWKPPAKPGVDKDWDAFDPDKAEAPPAAKVPKLTDIAK